MRFPIEITFEYLNELNQELTDIVTPGMETPDLTEIWNRATDDQRRNLVVNYLTAVMMAEAEKEAKNA